MPEMLSKNHVRRLAVILLIAALLFVAMAHGGSGVAAAILIPIWFCFDAIVALAVPRVEEHVSIYFSPILPPFSPRPPPSIS